MQASLAFFLVGLSMAAFTVGVYQMIRRGPSATNLLLAAAGPIIAAVLVLTSTALVLDEPWFDLALRQLAADHSPPAIGLIAGLAAGWYLSRMSVQSAPSPAILKLLWQLSLPLSAAAAFLALSASGPAAVNPLAWLRGTPTPTPAPTAAPVEAMPLPSVETGFRISALLPNRDLDGPTAFTLDSDGKLYVATPGGILVFPANFLTDERPAAIPFSTEAARALGLVHRDDTLYASSQGRLLALPDTDGDRRADRVEVILEGMPHGEYEVHSNNGLAFDETGRLFMALGSTSDHGPEEHAYAGSILEVDVEARQFSVYARGLRNPYDLAFCPDGRLYASDNGPDKLDEALIYRPPDEVNLVLEGEDYGYPDFFGYPPPWSNTRSPIALLPMSSAAAGIHCYAAGSGAASFPQAYHGDLFVALWGTVVVPE